MMGLLLLVLKARPLCAFPGEAVFLGGNWSRGQLGTRATPLTPALFPRLTSAPETTSAGPRKSKGSLPRSRAGECWAGWVMPTWGHFWWLGLSQLWCCSSGQTCRARQQTQSSRGDRRECWAPVWTPCSVQTLQKPSQSTAHLPPWWPPACLGPFVCEALGFHRKGVRWSQLTTWFCTSCRLLSPGLFPHLCGTQ